MLIERKTYNTTLDIQVIKQLKILAAEQDRRQNDLIEEAIKDLVKKYKQTKKK
ncbi:MAG: ribbon-helix-helix domain-containing protein [Candidatus Hodarchaeota archaeon]